MARKTKDEKTTQKASLISEAGPILGRAYERARLAGQQSVIHEASLNSRLEYIAKHSNGAPRRLLLAGLVAKIHKPYIDIRRPYTEIDGEANLPDVYSGRRYDEEVIEPFIYRENLPCNSTTAFLTPAFRTKNTTLEQGLILGGRRDQLLYSYLLDVLDSVQQNTVSSESLLVELIRNLIIIRDANHARLNNLLQAMKSGTITFPLSSEGIVNLIRQHLESPDSSRLPVLVVAAAYRAATTHLGERVLPLEAHNAADSQTGALGDLQITLVANDRIITSYEMKAKEVRKEDLDKALQKLARYEYHIDNYIFITTAETVKEVQQYALSLYEKSGTEFVILDCLGFLRHFLHLFHRLRTQFLDEYQDLLLEASANDVRQELKETFLTLRRAAETAVGNSDEI